jgi:hypothetical protein
MNNQDSCLENSFELKAKSLKSKMLELNLARPDLIKGCSEKEIFELEKKCNVILPKSYIAFLKYFGHGLGGQIMYDIDILCNKILGLTDFLRNEILIEEEDPLLPEKAFVFSARYGEQYMFFDLENPRNESSIFYYKVDDKEFTFIDKTILDILEKQIELSVSLKNKREQRRKKLQ